MPSYRVTLTIGALRPGVEPEAVLPAAAAAARQRGEVEECDVAVVRGEPRVSVRFSVDDDDLGLSLGRRVRAVVAGLADVRASRVTRRYGSRWYEVGGP